MNILAVTRVYYGPGDNQPKGEQRGNDNEIHQKMKNLASGVIHKYQDVKNLVGKPPENMNPDHVYVYYHEEYRTRTHDYFSLIWLE